MREAMIQFTKSCKAINDLFVNIVCNYIDKAFKEDSHLSAEWLKNEYIGHHVSSIHINGFVRLIFRDNGIIDLSDFMNIGGYRPTEGINYTVVTRYFPEGFDARQLDDDIMSDQETCVFVDGNYFITDESIIQIQNYFVGKVNTLVKKVTDMTFSIKDTALNISIDYKM